MAAIEWVKEKAQVVGDEKIFQGNIPFRMVQELRKFAKEQNAHESSGKKYNVYGFSGATLRIGNMRSNNTHIIACFF